MGFIQFTSTAPGGFSYTSSGTLVQSANPFEYKFLTAAHVVDGENAAGDQTPDGVIDATSFTLYFGDNTGPGGNSAIAKVVVPSFAVSVQSFWATGNGASLPAGTAQYDLAVMTFDFGDIVSGTLPTPLGVSFANPMGQVGTMVGYGNWGNGQTFTDLAPDGIRRAGRNVIDSVGVAPDDTVSGFVIETDFDSPAGARAAPLAPPSPSPRNRHRRGRQRRSAFSRRQGGRCARWRLLPGRQSLRIRRPQHLGNLPRSGEPKLPPRCRARRARADGCAAPQHRGSRISAPP